jgi:tetratricopeptide (TPR) repeat protein
MRAVVLYALFVLLDWFVTPISSYAGDASRERDISIIEQNVAARLRAALKNGLNDFSASAGMAADFERVQKYEEALVIRRLLLQAAKEFASMQRANTQFGVNHPEAYERLVRFSEQDVWASEAALASILEKLGRYNEALPIRRRILEHRVQTDPYKPNHAAPMRALADSLIGAGNYSEALAIAEEMLSREESLAQNAISNKIIFDELAYIAGIYWKQRDYANAFSYYTKAAGIATSNNLISPLTIEVHLGVGFTALKLAQPQSACDAFKSALQVDDVSRGWTAWGGSDESSMRGAIFFGLGEAYMAMNQPDLAVPQLEQSLRIRTKAIGPAHADTLASLLSLSGAYSSLGDLVKAQTYAENALAVSKQVYGGKHAMTSAVMAKLAALYTKLEDYEHALALAPKALEIARKTALGDSRQLETSIVTLADLYRKVGDYGLASALYREALAIANSRLQVSARENETNVEISACLALTLWNQEEALPLFERLLSSRQSAFGIDHPKTSLAADNLADAYMVFGFYEKAIPILEHSLSLCEKSLGSQHAATAARVHKLGKAFLRMGNYEKALPLFERAVSIREATLGRDHGETALSINEMAEVHDQMANYAKALPLYERALGCFEASPEHNGKRIPGVLDSIASVYTKLGDFKKSLPLHKRALEAREALVGPEHPDVARSLRNTADVYLKVGDHHKAVELFARALGICEKSLGDNHNDTGKCLDGLANALQEGGAYDKALPLYQRALSIREMSVGAHHPQTADALENLANCYLAKQMTAEAMPLHGRALEIREEMLGPQHPDTARSLARMTELLYIAGNDTQAGAYASREVAARHRQLQGILTMDERSRLAWQAQNLSLGPEAKVLMPEQVAQLVLRWKGIVLESMLEDNLASGSAALAKKNDQRLAQVQALRSSLSQLSFAPGESGAADKIAEQIAALEREVGLSSASVGRVRSSADLTLDAIRPGLRHGGVLVDFFQWLDPKQPEDSRLQYGAAVTIENGSPQIIQLGSAASIESDIVLLRAALSAGNDSEAEKLNLTLSTKIWHPIAAAIPADADRVLISPEGKLNFLSFATLQDSSGSFAIESYPISYLASGRDLARVANSQPQKTLAIFANADFGYKSSLRDPDSPSVKSDKDTMRRQITLAPLPGTLVEANAVKKRAESAGWNVSEFVGSAANEENLRSLQGSGILHLATHGFYLNDASLPADGVRGMSVTGATDSSPATELLTLDPMRASGVALSGAQSVLDALNTGSGKNSAKDGIITADEVASLQLGGTWLVVLSACDTGVGEAKSGEGVFGLRRAFTMAGAQNLITTLWPVGDDTTAAFMKEFYSEALASRNVSRSLADAQREWLVTVRSKKGAGAAIREVGPFVLATAVSPEAGLSFSQGTKTEFLR